jgi:hypothetical protein
MQPQRDNPNRKDKTVFYPFFPSCCSHAILHIFALRLEIFLYLQLQSFSNDIDSDDWIKTPLMAVAAGRMNDPYPERLPLVKLLVKYNAEVNFSSQGFSVLDTVLEENCDFALQAYLESIGAKRDFYRKSK